MAAVKVFLTRSAGLGRRPLWTSNYSLVSVLRRNFQTTVHRNSGGESTWAYRRQAPMNPPIIDKLALGISTLMWWWISWHVFTEPAHLIGEFDYPNPDDWTDEELGIPPE